ncbi:MAG: SLBB domain-containing protein [Pseudomonadota bacterium]
MKKVFFLALFCIAVANFLWAEQVRTVPILSQKQATSFHSSAGVDLSGQEAPSSPGQPRFSEPSGRPPMAPETILPGYESKSDQRDADSLRERTAKPSPLAPKPEGTSISEQYFSGDIPLEVSTRLTQYGYDLFEQSPTTFAPVADVPIGPDYIIGPGDEIRITVWGQIEGQFNITVERDGTINLPKAGTVGVAGLNFSQVKDTIKGEFSRLYKGFEISVSMGALRAIKLYVVGNARRPGAYTVSSLSTLVSALFEAGGPDKTGSMRRVELKRKGETVTLFDMYDFLLKGDKSKDARLMPDDVIFIPPIGPVAAIAGNVKRPAIYELKETARLTDLIKMAGGLNSFAFKGRIQAQRIENHQFRVIYEGDLIDLEETAVRGTPVGNRPDSEEKKAKDFELRDGDLIKVFPIMDSKNTVLLTGAIANPGEYGVRRGGTTIRDVVSLAGGLLYYASNEAEVTRVNITQSGPQTERFSVDLKKAMEGDTGHNLLLEINDYLLVRSIPNWQLYRRASVSGEIKYPAVYAIQEGERLSSLIERAGGYTDRAYLRGAVFSRESVKKIQQKGIDEMISRLERELLAGSSVGASTAVSQEAIESKKVEIESQSKFLESLRSLKATGRMVIRLAHLRLLKGSAYDIELVDGDSLYIPEINEVVTVTGAVMSPGSFIYIDNVEHDDYIAKAGGFSRYADEKNIYVYKVDGSARKLSRSFLGWNSLKSRWEVEAFTEKVKELEPGDSVIVPERLERVAWLREIKDITQILMQIAVVAGVTVNLF